MLNFGPWWEGDPADVAKSITLDFRNYGEISARSTKYRVYEALYANQNVSSSMSPVRAALSLDGCKENPTFNLPKVHVDIIMAQVSGVRPRPFIVSAGGDTNAQKKAKKAGDWVNSFFSLNYAYEEGHRATMDALIYGTGALKTYIDGDKIMISRVNPEEIFVDELEMAYSNEPTHLYHRTIVSRYALKQMYPKFAKEIEKAEPIVSDHLVTHQTSNTNTPRIDVVEAWKLPTVHGGKDGRHIIMIADKILVDEPWKVSIFPFEFIRWGRQPRGFFGAGVIDDVIGLHVNSNQIIERVLGALDITPQATMFVHTQANVPPEHLDNFDGKVVEYSGSIRPEISAPNPINPVYMNMFQELLQLANVSTGVSSAAAQNKLPSGLETGQAVRDFDDLNTRRFNPFVQDISQMYVGLSRKLILMGHKLYGSGKRMVHLESSINTIEAVPWEDLAIDIADESYYIRVHPVTSLSYGPESKIRQSIALFDKGLMTPKEARNIINFPDLDAMESLNAAPGMNVDRVIDAILETGKVLPLEDYLPADIALEKARLAINKAQLNDVPDDRLRALEIFMEAASDKVTQSRQAAQQEQAQAQMNASQGQATQQ